jgi:hypothetical protein
MLGDIVGDLDACQLKTGAVNGGLTLMNLCCSLSCIGSVYEAASASPIDRETSR